MDQPPEPGGGGPAVADQGAGGVAVGHEVTAEGGAEAPGGAGDDHRCPGGDVTYTLRIHMRSVSEMDGWQRVATDVWRLPGRGVDPNAYLIGDVLVDSASRLGRRRLLRRLAGSPVRAHVLSHVHPPTQGASRAVAERFGAPVWCGHGDAEALERGDARPWQPKSLVNDLQAVLLAGPGVAPARRLIGGDRVGDFTVVETPGHSPGHIALWRPDDKVLLAGDVVTAVNVLTGRKGLHEPPRVFTQDPERNRRSAWRLAALGAETVLFSHGPPLYDGGRLADFVSRLAPQPPP